jgi:hypothetical protein
MILALKLILTPLLIAAATLAGRRWGPGVSGWLIGLPLTSGPVSLILALQNGTSFAAASAVGVLAGQASVCVFCLLYAILAQTTPWTVSAALGLAGFLAATFLLRLASLTLWPTLALVIVVITTVALVIPRGVQRSEPSAPPAWDLPARMATATAFVLALTSAAGWMGPQMSGLLSPFPVFGVVLAAFAHRGQGADAAARLLRGVVVGSFGFAAFFLMVCLVVTAVPIGLAYLLALAAAVSVNSISLRSVR